MKKIILVFIIFIISINNCFSNSDIKISKYKNKVFIKQGNKIEKNIKLINTTGKRIIIKIRKAELKELQNIKKFNGNKINNEDIGNDLFSLSLKSIVLEPHSNINYKYYISIPEDIPKSNYFGAIFFEYNRQFIYKKGGTYYKNIKINYSFDINVIKNYNISLKKLNKKIENTKYSKNRLNIDTKIEKLTKKQLIIINRNIENINYKNKKYKKYKKYEDLINYINIKIKIILENKDVLEYSKINKLIKNKNINKIHLQNLGGICSGDCDFVNYIIIDNYLISYVREYYEKNNFKYINITRTDILLSKFLKERKLEDVSKLNLLEDCNSCSDGIDTDIIIDYNGKRFYIDYDAVKYENLEDNKYYDIKKIFLFLKEIIEF